MIPKGCKRLAEVDFPIAIVSKHAAREKSIRHGHPSTLHLWWARRPLASSRAVLLALLLPDPCDPHCPAEFKVQATEILTAVRQRPENDTELRTGLLWFIGAFANWDMAAHPTYLQVGRSLVRAAHGEEAPLVVDPFAGGGSIPLEALRLGCEAFASDLNPVACLILKVMLEDIPRYGPKLAEELRRLGSEIKAVAEAKLAGLYPCDPDGRIPIAYLWARTVRCEAPNCGAEIPLVRSFWLCKKAPRKRALRLRSVHVEGQPPRVELEIFEPVVDTEVPEGTVASAKAVCICCGTVMPPERVRAQLTEQSGGADVIFDERGRRAGGAFLLAVVTVGTGEKGRRYRLAARQDYETVHGAQKRVAEILDEWERGGRQGRCPVPDAHLNPIRPSPNARGLSAVTRYGMTTFGDLFTARQKVALITLSRLVATHECTAGDKQLLALSVSRFSDITNSLCRWENTKHQVRNLFARQAIPMLWDFAEAGFVGGQAGDYLTTLSTMIRVVDHSQFDELEPGQVQAADATGHPLPDQAADVWFTDPPYYDAIPYSDLSDFFLVWLQSTLPDYHGLNDPFDSDNRLSPKVQECVWNRSHQYGGRPKDAAFFETSISKAFGEGRRILSPDGIASVVFAHQSTAGWEALLGALVTAGWTVTGSWPVATEMASRIRARDNASLATSVHLVCRPRPEDAPVGEWADVLRELPARVDDWMETLQGEGIRGADLVFACIGPALEIFSRYRAVETAEGCTVKLADYLEKVWEVVGRTALASVLGAAEAKARNGLAGALEEDSRLTALFLWTLQTTTGEGTGEAEAEDADAPAGDGTGQDVESAAAGKTKGFSLVFDVVRRFAQPLGIDLEQWNGRTIETKKGVVRLLPVAERAKQLFGERGSQAVAARLEQEAGTGTDPLQGVLFSDQQEDAAVAVREGRPRYGDGGANDRSVGGSGATTLDRVHTGMLLQASGRTNALRALVQAEQERGPDYLRLANALSALYPRGSHEKRLLDAMLLAVPR